MLKAIRRELLFGNAAERDQPISTHVPYTRHISPTVIGMENSAMVSVIKLDGLFFQSLDQAELNSRWTMWTTMIKALGSSRYSLWTTIVRRRIDPKIPGTFDDNFCGVLNERYMASLAEKSLFINELYLTVVQSGLRGVLGMGDRVKQLFRGQDKTETEHEAVTELEQRVANMVAELKLYGARVLGVTTRDGDYYSEPCEFFNTILTCGTTRNMRLPRMGIRDYVGTSRLFFGKKTIQADGGCDADHRFGAMLSIKEYPPYTAPGILDNLLQVNQEFILTQSFSLTDKPIALERISRLQRQFNSADERDSSVVGHINQAKDDLLGQSAVFGMHHLSLLCVSRNLDDLGRVVSDLGSCLTDSNITWLREDLNTEAAFWAQLPGARAYIARDAMLASPNFTGMTSFHSFAVGRTENLKWGTPIALLETVSQTPYAFNFHNERGVGNFLVTGPTGSGKTVAMTFLLAQAFRVKPRPRAVFFDKDRGAEIFIRAMGGQYELLEPGTPTGFNPLQMENTGPNREFLARLFKVMLSGADPFTQQKETTLERAIVRIMKEPVEHRTLVNFSDLLRGGRRADSEDLAARLRPWVDGEKSWLFNAEQDALSFSGNKLFGFDMSKILSLDDLRTPALMYIFQRLDELLDGNPVMIFMDEGWQLLQDEAFSAFITDKMKTIRKLNGIIGFGTQSAADIAKAKISHTLIEQATTHIHFPNSKADQESYVDKFKLTAKEFHYVQNTAPEKRTFLIKHGNDSVIARLDLSGLGDLVQVLSGNETTVQVCEELRKQYGEAPEQWLPHFYKWNSTHKHVEERETHEA